MAPTCVKILHFFLPMSPPFFACLEETAQGGGVGLVGAQLDRINPNAPKETLQLGLRSQLLLGKTLSVAWVVGVDFDHLAGLGVTQHQTAQRGQFQLETIRDLHRHDIMPPIGLPQSGRQRRLRDVARARRGSGGFRFEEI